MSGAPHLLKNGYARSQPFRVRFVRLKSRHSMRLPHEHAVKRPIPMTTSSASA